MSGLEEMIAAQRMMGRRLAERTAEIAAPLLEARLKASAAAGTSPDGQPWAARKDGGRAMANAAKAISVKAIGDVVRVTLDGPEVFWHYGARGAPRRPVIPDGGGPMSRLVQTVLDEASAKAFAELAGSDR